MKLFIDYGIDVNRPNSIGIYPIALACESGNIEQVRLLLNHGANPNVQSDGSTPLIQSCINNNSEVVKLLIEHGADVNFVNSEGLHPLLFLVNESEKNVTKLFLSYGANPNIQDTEGNSALSMACARGNRRIVELLLQSPNINIDLPTKGNYTPLMAACNIQEYMIAVKLIEAGASLYFKNDYGQ
ncbi:ankyrin, partial [Anaeromyces robustus]